MAEYLPIRALTRSQAVRIWNPDGPKQALTISRTASTYVKISDPKVRKDLSYHSAIGAIIVTGGVSGNNTGATVVSGGAVSEGGSAADRILDVSAGVVKKADGTRVTVAGGVGSVTLATAHATLGRNDLVVADATTGAVSGVSGATGTGAAAATAPVPDTPTGKVRLAVVARAATDDAIANADINNNPE